MSENIEVPKEVVEKFNNLNKVRRINNKELLKYVAMDSNGGWFGYCTKPMDMGGRWNSSDSSLLAKPYYAPYWENSLTEMPLEDI